MEIKNLVSYFSTSLETSMLRYIFAVTAASAVYALVIYGALNNQTPINCCTTTNCIGFGVTK